MDSPYWKGPFPGVDVQRRLRVENVPGVSRTAFRGQPKSVRLQPGILFGFTPERCSACPGIRSIEGDCEARQAVNASDAREFRGNILRRFAVRIREPRNQRAWSKGRLAEEAGTHRTYLGGIETARRLAVHRSEGIALIRGVPPVAVYRFYGNWIAGYQCFENKRAGCLGVAQRGEPGIPLI